jgi:hypothetical protein
MTQTALQACPMCDLPLSCCPCDSHRLFTLGDDDSITVEGEAFTVNIRVLHSTYEQPEAPADAVQPDHC